MAESNTVCQKDSLSEPVFPRGSPGRSLIIFGMESQMLRALQAMSQVRPAASENHVLLARGLLWIVV